MGIKVRKGGVWVEVSSGGGGSSDPVGTIVAWAGSVASIPSEYQLCDGSSAPASLQSIVGSNVPDLRDKFIVGAGNTYAVDATGGAATHTLTVGEMPSHNHPFPQNSNGTYDYYWIGQSDVDTDFSWSTGPSYELTTTSAVASQGGGQAHNNLPPYHALCYIIKHTATSGGGSGGGGTSQTWIADYQNVQSETGSNVEWTGIPEDTQRIIIMFRGVSPGSGQDWLVQLGNTSGNYSAGVYESASVNPDGSAKRYDTEGFIINVTANSAVCNGRMVIERNRQNNTRGWVATGQVTNGTTGGMRHFAGSFASSTTSSVFDRIRFTSENLTDRCFDAGYISILCEGPGGGSGSGGTDAGQGFFENDTTLNTSTTLSSNKNVGVFGPYTIGNNVTLTVPTGTTFTVV